MKYRLIQETRQLYLWSVGVIYLFAFVSLYLQIPGLYGSNGLLPVYNVIPKQQENQTFSQHLESLYKFPSVLIYFDYVGLPPELVMELCCIAGALLSFLIVVFRPMRCSLIFLLLWMIYLSLHQVGQTFLYFQWDSLLLETGILTVILAPLNIKFWKKSLPRPHDGPTFWLIRWLLFRLMFASGVVKLTSHCPTWWDLTALHWHYESQCIPTPLAWYAHQLPGWFQSLSVVGTYYIEIVVPFFFFLPVRSLRLYAFFNQIFFQLCIIATGNYNFFNLLTIALCISLLDDNAINSRKRKGSQDWSKKLIRYFFGRCTGFIHGVGKFLVFWTVVGVSIGAVVYFFNITIDFKRYEVHSKIGFSKKEFEQALQYAVPLAAVMGGVSLFLQILRSIWDSWSKQSVVNRIWFLFQSFLMCAIVITMFSISLIPLSYLDRSLQTYLPREVITAHDTLGPFQFTNSYGLFRRMTGVGGRPELVIEGANSEGGPWIEYEFYYKPGSPSKPLPLVAPHQPRLDWQMWFGALSNYENNPWLVNLVYRLLSGEKDVLELMHSSPFKKPPKYIRVGRYVYHYTKYDASLPLLGQTGPWWNRKYQSEYLFSLSLDHAGLQDYLKKMKTNEVPVSHCNIQYLCGFLDSIRTYSRLLPPTEVCLASITMATLLQITLSIIPLLFNSSSNTLTLSVPQVDKHLVHEEEGPQRKEHRIENNSEVKVKERKKNKKR